MSDARSGKTIALKLTRRLLKLPIRLTEIVEGRLQMSSCLASDDVYLYPGCHIENGQKDRRAISIGAHSRICGDLVVLPRGGKIRIGEYCFLSEHSRIWSAATVTIGDRVLVSHCVNIHDHNSHSLSAASRHIQFKRDFLIGHAPVLEDFPGAAPIIIEDDAWLGFNCTILRGVTVGRCAIIAAGSMVTKDVEAYTIVAGNPVRAIGRSKP